LFNLFEITSIRLYTPLRNPLHGLHSVYNLIEVISSWTEQKLQSILNYLPKNIDKKVNFNYLPRNTDKKANFNYLPKNIDKEVNFNYLPKI
jgi:hypothetical protein